MDEAGILLEHHYRVAELFLLCGLIYKVIASLEDGVILYTIAEVLDHWWLYLFVLDEDGEADVVEFPPSIDVEVVANFAPLCWYLVDQLEIGLYDLHDLLEMHFVERQVPPKKLVPLYDHTDQLLNL